MRDWTPGRSRGRDGANGPLLSAYVWLRHGAPRARLALATLAFAAVAPVTVAAQKPSAPAPGGATEALELRTATTKTFEHADGRVTKRLFSAPVHRYEGGQWRSIDGRFVPAAPAEAAKGYRWRTKSHRFNVLARPKMQHGFLRFDTAGEQFALSLTGAAARAGTADGGQLRFDDVFRGVDLRYAIQPDGIKELLLLKDASAPTEFRFLLEPPSGTRLHADRLADGSYAFNLRSRGRAAFVISPPYATDEPLTQARRGAKTRHQKRDRDDHMRMRVERVGQAFAITLSVDREWLSRKERSWPVTVDPTIRIQPTSQDANFTDCATCFGEDYGNIWIGTDEQDAWRGAFQFDLGQVPAGASVTGATFGVYNQADYCVYTSDDVCGLRSHTLDLHRMSRAWSQSSTGGELGWASTPDASAVLPAGAGDQWINWNVLPLAQSWVEGTSPNYGFLVKRSSELLNQGGPEVPAASWDYGDPSLRPRLDITYAAAAVALAKPESLHSNGAELEWTRFESTNGPFDRYEVHRSTNARFTPSSSTLLTVIQDVDTTTFVDTTAAPDRTFTYKVVANGTESVARTVKLPPDGQGRKVLQPAPEQARAASIASADGAGDCSNYGADSFMYVGSDTWLDRSLLRFDLGIVPTGAAITQARLSTYVQSPPRTDLTVGAYRSTAAWTEGTGVEECSGDGASWNYRTAGERWEAGGGDFTTAPADSVAHYAGDVPGWDDFDVTGIVEGWVDGDEANNGFVLKPTDESHANGKYLAYLTDDYSVNPLQRPKLEVTFADGSHATGPTASLFSPVAGDVVRNTIAVAGTATDDRRVEKVELLVDGAVKAADVAAPYTFDAVDTRTLANGSRTLRLRATDDAGNVTLSPEVVVQVANSALPITRVTSPSNKYADHVVAGDLPYAYWRLGEWSGSTATDASGNARHGAYGGSVTLGQAGLLTGDTDRSANFANNVAGDGQMTRSLSGLLASNRFTFEAWVNAEAVPLPLVFSHIASRGWGSPGGWRLAMTRNSSVNGEPMLEVAYNDNGTVKTSTKIITAATHHLALFYDGSWFDSYIDGTLGPFVYAPGETLPDTAALTLGQTLESGMRIDEAAVYDRALSPAEIRQHHRIGTGSAPVVTGQVPVTAAATDDGTVDRVEFLVDGNRFAEDRTAPYTATLPTLGADPVYDGAHTLTTIAYDNHGQAKPSVAVPITVANRTESFKADIVPATPVPLEVSYVTGAATQDAHPVDVTVTNRGTSSWPATDVVLRPRWIGPDGGTPVAAAADVPVGALAPGAATTLRTQIRPPALPDGVDRALYRLQLDLFSTRNNASYADKGNQPSESKSTVKREAVVGLGIERYYEYDAVDVGAGMSHMVNLASGNSLLHWTPFSAPGRGLDTVVNLTYNSLEHKSESTIGNNFSLSISSLTRFGTPLDIHPNNADTNAGRANNKYVDLTDGDGTTHRFTGKLAADGTTVYWEEPAGVHLWLRTLPGTDTTRRWALTRPDRTTFYYDVDGWPTSIEDRNGNKLLYTLQATPPGEDPGGPKKRITKITDAAGNVSNPAARRSFDITYWSSSDAQSSHVRGSVKRITDRSGSPLDFEYYDDGNLRRLIQRGGVHADGRPLPDRVIVFTYTTSNGAEPAIPAAADRVDPSPKTPNQSTRLYSVRDPRGAETLFEYLGPGDGTSRWKLSARTDREGKRTTYAYDLANRRTTVTRPLGRTQKNLFDTDGKAIERTDAKNQTTQIQWTADRHVWKVVEPSSQYMEYSYDQNGYVTGQWNQKREYTKVEYDYLQADATGLDTSGKWKAGRTVPHISQLKRVTKPKGTATAAAGDYEWDFVHDAKGNPTHSYDPLEKYSQRQFNADGTVAWSRDQRGKLTTFPSYDANGIPTAITDAENQTTRFFHDDDGLLRWVQDPLHAAETTANDREYREHRSYFDYDSFHRMGRQSAPKWTRGDRYNLLWSFARFDANDNTVEQIGAHAGRDYTGAGARTTKTYDAMDRLKVSTGSDKTVDPAGERWRYDYDDAGRLTKVFDPRAMRRGVSSPTSDQHRFQYDYDLLDRVQTQHARRWEGATLAEVTRKHFCYDDPTGDVKWVVSPRNGAVAPPCASATKPPHTTSYVHDAVHRWIQRTDGGNRVAKRDFDANGNLDWQEDAAATRIDYDYDQRDLMTTMVQPLEKATNRLLTTKYEYDDAGNRSKVISPRAIDVANGATPTQHLTSYVYDNVNRVTRVDLPKTATEAQLYVHRRYDPNGNMVANSVPVTQSNGGDRTLNVLTENDKTIIELFDTGWIRQTNEPGGGTPAVQYDYTPEGWQASKQTVGRPAQRWEYYADGQLKVRKDRRGDATTYVYDENDNLTRVNDGSGALASGEQPVDITSTFDGLDRPLEVAHHKRNTQEWSVTKYVRYDLAGNLEERVDGIKRNGTTDTGGRRHVFVYDGSNWATDHTDYGPTANADDDRVIKTGYFDTGWEKDQTITGPTSKQSTAWTYFDNGLPRTLTTRDKNAALLESHNVSYIDDAGDYANGHRTSDVFTVNGSNQSAPCRGTTTCTNKYAYDARERLIEEKRIRPSGTKTTSYAMLPNGSVDVETRPDGVSIDHDYSGQQLHKRTITKPGMSAFVERYRHDGEARMDCVWDATSGAGESVCGTANQTTPSASLMVKNDWDELDRLTRVQSWEAGGSGRQRDDSTTYGYDALDRTTFEDEKHGTTTKNDRRTEFEYLGTSNKVAKETARSGTSSTRTKTFSFDAFGEPVSMTDKPNGMSQEEYTFGRDVQGSVSLLVNSAGTVKGQYGYTAYGDTDGEMTHELDPAAEADPAQTDKRAPAENPLNPTRFQGKRFDSGSESVDMGARRFSPDIHAFMQQDTYDDALGNLGLSTDPLTQNRFSLAGGNPVSFVEYDGHEPIESFRDRRSVNHMYSGRRRRPTRRRFATPDAADRNIRPAYQKQIDRSYASATAKRAKASAASKQKEGGGLRGALHTGLDVVGLVPVVGEAADLANAGLYLAEGNKTDAALSAAGAIPVAGWAATAGKAGRRIHKAAKSCNSFVRGTPVTLANGQQIGIEGVEVGDHVLATDPVTGETRPYQVTRVLVGGGAKRLVALFIDGQTMVATADHPIYSQKRGKFVAAKDLRAGDHVRRLDGTTAVVGSVTAYSAMGMTVHNLTVEGAHTFYAGTSPLLVHNAGGRYCDLPGGPNIERHHMPSKSSYSSKSDARKGPAIEMSREDHMATGSWGRRAESQEYQARQRELQEQGRFDDAFEMDIDDIQSKFGDKYDDDILEAIDAIP